jgi:hypothetical protein
VEDAGRARDFQPAVVPATKRDREDDREDIEQELKRPTNLQALEASVAQVVVTLAALEDMCEPLEPSLKQHYNEAMFYDENTGEELGPVLVAKACEDELQRFKKMNVYRLVLKTEGIRERSWKSSGFGLIKTRKRPQNSDADWLQWSSASTDHAMTCSRVHRRCLP